jgi:RHS repeat-associated protein
LQQSNVTRNGVSQTTSYEYDGLGRRTRKIDAFGQTEFLWDGDLMIHSQRGSKQALFIYEPNSFVPLATLQDGETYWYQCDQIGTPQELTDKNGDVVWAAQYKVWGVAALLKLGNGYNQWQNTAMPVLEQPFRFQGQQFDEETGLHYNRFRYYDPQIGRFVSQDPIGLVGGNNNYQYAPNSTGWIDLLGLQKMCTCGCPYVDQEMRWGELANDSNTPSHIKGWIKHQQRQVALGKQAYVKAPPGYDLGHKYGMESSLGYDFSHADPNLRADHQGIHHRYYRKLGGCFTVAMPKSGPIGRGKLSLPKPGSLP